MSSIEKNKNRLLSSLSAANLNLLLPHLEIVDLPVRRVLEECNKPITHVYFPESGIVSVVAQSSRDIQIEAGIIGREGMTGLAVIMGDDRTPHATYMQVAGTGLRIETEHLREALAKSRSLHQQLLHFAQAFMVQIAHTALANGRCNVEERLSRWLLMARDRQDDNALTITHEFLALMLGVRRAGVTMGLKVLEQQDLIETKRGIISIQNRKGLENIANGSYGIPEREYVRLVGVL